MAELRARAADRQTLDELARNFADLFPDGQTTCVNSAAEVRANWDPEVEITRNRSVWWNEPLRSLTVASVDPYTEAPVGGILIRFGRQLDGRDLGIAGWMAKVFNYDVAVAPGLLRDKELWLNLQQTRFSRVIARAASFHTDILFRWLRNYENAGSLRYEGSPFSAAMILVKQRTYLKGKASLDFLKFSEPLSLTRALFEEKWVRALASGGHVYLVGLGHDNGVIGVAVTRETEASEGKLFPPHRSLAGLTSALGPGMLALTMSENGDLYVLLPNGVTFVKSQGRWRYLNFNLLNSVLSGCLQSRNLPGLVRVIADMSYERRGALFAICDDRSAIGRLVPDHANSDRINKPVRSFARRLKVSDASHRLVLGNVAAIDGAVILNGNGEVLDAACMIATPSEIDLASAGIAQLSSHAGARTTAAWNASVLGTAVKVSEDGPISVFRKGVRVLQIG